MLRIYPLLMLFCVSLSFLQLKSQDIGEIQYIPSPILDGDGSGKIPGVQFGQITVPENYENPYESKLLKISFAIIEARNKPALPDPVVIFAGGWGSPILKHIYYFQEHFLGENRDLILFDYRGLGYSEPKICPGLENSVYEELLKDRTEEDFDQWQIQNLNNCLDELEKQGIDFSQYGTDQRSKDANLLLERLPYDSYNLFGTSGGTRAIQSFIRNASVEIRSAILDSTVPIGWPIIYDVPKNYSMALERIFTACEKDPSCNTAYPELEARYLSFLGSLEERPLKLQLKGGVKAVLNKQEVNALIHNQLYEEYDFATLPFFIHTLIKRNNFILRRMIHPISIEQALKESINGPGFLNYMNDYRVFKGKALYEAQLSSYKVLDGYGPYFTQDQRFTSWPDEAIPVESDIKALFLVGTYDPTTPPAYTDFILPNFPNNQVVQLYGVGHGVFNNDCGVAIILEFIEAPGLPIKSPCLSALKQKEIEFFIRGKKSK